MPDTVQDDGFTARSCVKEVVTIKSKTWLFKPRLNPFDACDPRMLLYKSVVEEFQSRCTILRKDKNPTVYVVDPGFFLLKGKNETSILQDLFGRSYKSMPAHTTKWSRPESLSHPI